MKTEEIDVIESLKDMTKVLDVIRKLLDSGHMDEETERKLKSSVYKLAEIADALNEAATTIDLINISEETK